MVRTTPYKLVKDRGAYLCIFMSPCHILSTPNTDIHTRERHRQKCAKQSAFLQRGSLKCLIFYQHEIADTPNPHTSQSHHSTPTHPPPRSAANRSVYTHMHTVFRSNSGDRCDIPPSLRLRVRVCVCVICLC